MEAVVVITVLPGGATMAVSGVSGKQIREQ
jgi:hypothetical protein